MLLGNFLGKYFGLIGCNKVMSENNVLIIFLLLTNLLVHLNLVSGVASSLYLKACLNYLVGITEHAKTCSNTRPTQ